MTIIDGHERLRALYNVASDKRSFLRSFWAEHPTIHYTEMARVFGLELEFVKEQINFTAAEIAKITGHTEEWVKERMAKGRSYGPIHSPPSITTEAEYTRAVKAYFRMYPETTVEEFAKKIARSVEWVNYHKDKK